MELLLLRLRSCSQCQQLSGVTEPLLAREGSLPTSLNLSWSGGMNALLMLGTNWKCRSGINPLLHLCKYLECRWSVLGDLQSRERSLNAVIALGADAALGNFRAQGVGEAGLCSVPTRGCIWHPFQEQGWDFEECVDRLALQQTANQTVSHGSLCGDCPVSAA